MDTSALLQSVLAGTRELSRAMATEVHELDGVVAAVVPACPERSVVNSVSYARAEALTAVLGELARIYDDAGVHAWTVWVYERLGYRGIGPVEMWERRRFR